MGCYLIVVADAVRDFQAGFLPEPCHLSESL
jgi:hypothetical protein